MVFAWQVIYYLSADFQAAQQKIKKVNKILHSTFVKLNAL